MIAEGMIAITLVVGIIIIDGQSRKIRRLQQQKKQAVEIMEQAMDEIAYDTVGNTITGHIDEQAPVVERTPHERTFTHGVNHGVNYSIRKIDDALYHIEEHLFDQNDP